jgi:processive 1,2-diacylglycerol beta-glucosyltransferase
MPKVLLLTAGYGEGHNAAARGLHAALLERGADAEIVDLFALTGGAYYERSRRDYLTLINRAPKLWAAVYRLIDVLPVVPLMLPLLGTMRDALAALLKEKRPDVVVSVYPVYAYLIEQLAGARGNGASSKRRFSRSAHKANGFAFHTIVTDSITINSVWYRALSDTFLVPNEESAAVMRQAGLPEERVRVLGFPVPPRFARDRPERPAPQPPRVLYMINAGKEQAPEIVDRLLQIRSLHLTVTYGRDEVLRERLVAIAAGRPLELHGWTNQMPELLMTHHVLIGKAGGATVQEAIAAATPMLITQVVPGQEEGNAQLLFQNNAGALCPTAEALAEKIESLFAHDARDWREWERNIARLSRPAAALQIADFVLKAKAA